MASRRFCLQRAGLDLAADHLSHADPLALRPLVDLACGTAYWLPHYARQCSSITLFDQSEKMLQECRKKVHGLGIVERYSLLQADFFDYKFGAGAHDCALVGFFLSHLTQSQERSRSTRLGAC